MLQQAPESFTKQIKALFEKRDWPAAQSLLQDNLKHGWTGLYGLLAMTYMHQADRTAQDCLQALEWLERGVLACEPDSLAMLGRVLLSGELGQQDFARGLALLGQAAELGVLMAVLTLLQIHEHGVEEQLAPDAALAQRYLEQAADLGDPASAYRLAVLLEQGGQAPERAFRYYDKAAQGGMEQAMHNVGVCYLHGKGVAQNLRLAHAYFTEAAKLASPLSVISLALLHLDANLGMQDRGVALGWVCVYQALFPHTEVPDQLMALLAEASNEEHARARALAQHFLRTQLLKSPQGTVH
ncbi:MAG TPA: tetratricopeptide repeat protein [Limnobacter sp.]|nr:tetratricopeptide repeat protein [Limnobacter sp.]